MKPNSSYWHPDQNIKFRPTVKPDLALWSITAQVALMAAAKGTTTTHPSSAQKHGSHFLSRRRRKLVCTWYFPLIVPNNINVADASNTSPLVLFYFRAVLIVKPGRYGFRLGVTAAGSHALVLIPPTGRQTMRGTQQLGELCQPKSDLFCIHKLIHPMLSCWVWNQVRLNETRWACLFCSLSPTCTVFLLHLLWTKWH